MALARAIKAQRWTEHLCRSKENYIQTRYLRTQSYAASAHRDQPVVLPQSEETNGHMNWLARSAVVVGAGFSIGLAAYFYLGRPPVEAPRSNVLPPRPVKVTVGGPFTLVDQDGKVRTNLDFVGKWCLVYLGYTHCPEDCPRQLQKIAEVVQRLEKAGQETVPIFMTVDPERDNCSQLKQYLKEFHPRYVGLTGKPSDIRPVLWKFRAYFRKTEEDGLDYLVEHSSSIYLMNPKMECVRVFGPEYHLQSLVEGIEKEMKIFKESCG